MRLESIGLLVACPHTESGSWPLVLDISNEEFMLVR